MTMHIRPFTPDDYAARTAIRNALYPRQQQTVDQMRRNDEPWEPQYFRAILVAEQHGAVLGYGLIQHMSWTFHPRKFMFNISVPPEQQGQGVGHALYTALIDQIAPHNPLAVRAQYQEDQPRSARFLLDRGFVEEYRVWESRLDVPSFDWTPFAGVLDQVAANGIEIVTLRELQARDPDWSHQLYATNTEVEQDVPAPEPITPWPYEKWLEQRMGSPDLLPDGYFVALDGDAIVGSSAVWSSEADNNLWTGLTGVKRSHRRRNIALALKLRVIRYAQQQQRPVIVTDNESRNRPMLAINERLGFVRQPAYINMIKQMEAA